MFLRVLLASVMLAASPVYASDYIVSTVTAYHFDRHKNYNERNFGLGLERQYSDTWAGSVGYYRNSYYRTTYYFFAAYTPLRLGEWRFGAFFGGVTGYENHPSPWLTGVATMDYGRIGLNLVLAPSAVALQLKLRID